MNTPENEKISPDIRFPLLFGFLSLHKNMVGVKNHVLIRGFFFIRVFYIRFGLYGHIISLIVPIELDETLNGQ